MQIIAGTAHAFPLAWASLAPRWPDLVDHAERVAARPRIAAYLASPARIPFGDAGIFRHYGALDGAVSAG